MSIRIDCPADPASEPDLKGLPAKPGVFVLDDAAGGTLALATTANLRRMVKSKLQARVPASTPARRPEYRSLTRTILATRVGSAFEADWAYLQLARQRLPATYRGLLDRWQAWFVHCDPQADFPQLVKTAHPKAAGDWQWNCESEIGDQSAFHPPTPSPPHDVYLGPMSDKHAAGRYIELLEDAFDLCRYHHLLVQAPHATACAYKEMGRCPGPCDGSVSMESYRRQMLDAIDFAATPIQQWREQAAQAMTQASEALDFEAAQRWRTLLERTASAARPGFALVDRLERFVFLAVMPGEKKNWTKFFLIRGGWIEPIAHRPNWPEAAVDELLGAIRQRAKPQAADFSAAGIENLGMVCWHLFRPRHSKRAGIFLCLDDQLNSKNVATALRLLHRKASHDEQRTVADQGMENLAADADQA